MTCQEIDCEGALQQLGEPRIEQRGTLLIAGMRGQFTGRSENVIAGQWQRFAENLGFVPGQVGRSAYGVCVDCAGADTFEYVCGVEVENFKNVPANWARLQIPATTYAVFPHDGHVSTLRCTVQSILEDWLPTSGYQAAQTGATEPDFIEHYGEGFDPLTGCGDIEVWLPIEA